VREGADRTGAAHRVHLGDAEQSGSARDGRVHAPAVLGLRRRRERDRADPRDLRRDDVHDDARRIDRLAPRHVQADPSDGLPALLDDGARTEHRTLRRRYLRGTRGAHAFDRALDRVADLGSKPVAGRRELGRGHPHRRRSHPVEAFCLLHEGGLAALAHVMDQPPRRLERGRDVGGRTRHEGEQLARGWAGSAEVDRAQHGDFSLPSAAHDAPTGRHRRQPGPSRLLSSP